MRRPVTWTRWRNSARCRCPASKTWPPTHPPNRRPPCGPGDKPGSARADVRQRRSSSTSGCRRSLSSIGDWLGFLAIAALAARIGAGLAGGRRRPGDVGAHRARASSSAPPSGVFVDRFDRKKAHGRLRPRPGRRARAPAVRRHRRRPGVRLARCSSASRCCGRRPRRHRSRTWCRPTTSPPPTRCRSSRPTAPCRSPAAIFSVLAVGGEGARRDRRPRRASRPTRWPSRSTSNAAALPRRGRDDLAAARCPSTRSARRTGDRPHRLRAGLPRAEGGLVVHLHQPGGAGRERRPGHRPDRRRHARAARPGVLRPRCSTPAPPASASSSSRWAPASPSAWCCCRCSSATSPRPQVFAGVGLRRGRSRSSSRRPCPRSGSRRCSSASWACAPGRCTCSASRCCTRTSTTSCAAGSSPRSTRWCGSACCVAFAVGPFLSGLLDRLSEDLVGGEITVAGVSIAVPGVRLTLWLAGLIIVGAGVLATVSLRSAAAVAPAPRTAERARRAPAPGGRRARVRA